MTRSLSGDENQLLIFMADASIILGKYELLEVIGDGKEGRVYKARCIAEGVSGISRGELVALKRLKSTGHDKESHQFQRQIQILRKLDHPNIVRYKDSFIWRENELEEDIYCLVLELIDGEPLKARLQKNGGSLAWDQAQPVFVQILQALAYAAKHGIIHRDLKPSNILVTRQGQPKLIDFGIARQDDGEGTATNTAAGARGTFDYMAPDFANPRQKGFRGDEQSDIFSFGVLLYHALTGRLPYPPLGENPVGEYYIRWLGTELPKVQFRHPVFRILQHARPCIAKCLEADRTTRFRSFAELMGEFSKVGYRRMKLGAEIYEMFEWLGKGGFGEVFRARRQRDQREVAIKRLFSPSQASRFVREAKILQNAPHSNLVEYIDFIEVPVRMDEREYYLILEYLEGMPGASLRNRIKNSEAGLEVAETLGIFVDYLDCLEHLHRNGIVHRDLKPGNLYVSGDHPPKAKIFDLGIAYDEEGTRTHGQVPGTLDFMPPEFARGSSGRGSPQSDIYSIGVTLYQSLTKKLPFPALPLNETEAWIGFIERSEKPIECAFDHSVFIKYPELVPMLRRALSNDPRRRHESARALQDEIRGIIDGWEKKKLFDASMSAGLAAFDRQDYVEAEQQVVRALALVPRDRAAELLYSKIQQGRQQQYQTDVAAALAALARGDYEEAKRQAELALKLVPSDPTASQLLSQTQPEKIEKTSAAAIEEQPTAVTIEPIESDNTGEATAETRPTELKQSPAVEHPVQEEVKPDEPAAQVIAEAEQPPVVGLQEQPPMAHGRHFNRRLLWMVTTSVTLMLICGVLYVEWGNYAVNRYQKHMAAGQEAYNRKAFANAIKEAKSALAIRPQDGPATKLMSDAEAGQRAEEDREYNVAMEAGKRAYEVKDYDTAIAQAEAALAIKAGDLKAAELKNDAQARKAEIADREQRYNTAMEAGQKAYDLKDYDTAIAQAETALAIKAGDLKAAELKSDAQARKAEIAERERRYNMAMEAGPKAYDLKDYDTAIAQAEAALAIKAGDLKAVELKKDAQARKAEVADRERRYNVAMEAGRKAYDLKDYDTAIAQAETALAIRAGDLKATKLKEDAQAGKAEITEQERKYQEAMEAGQKAYDLKDYDTAIAQAETALAIRAGDLKAAELKSDAQARKAEVADRERRYNVAMEAGRKAYDLKDYDTAIAQAEAALAIKAGDLKAAELKSDAQARKAEIADRERRYNVAMEAGQKAYDLKDYDTAIAQAETALAIKAGDLKAAELKSDAQARKAEIAERERRYNVAMEAGQKAYDLKDYDTAIAQAEAALAIKAGDLKAAELKSDAQARKAEIAERERRYNVAMEAGQKAYDLEDYDTTITQAEAALANKAGDAKATKLKNDALARKTEIAESAAAVAAGQQAYDRNEFVTAIKQADKALVIRGGDAAARKLKNDAQMALAALTKQKSDALNELMKQFKIPEFDFVWIAFLRDGRGAFVAKTELSQVQYETLASQLSLKSNKQPIPGATPDLPKNLYYEEARALVVALNNRAGSLLKQQGEFQLPSREDFLIYSDMAKWTNSPNPRYNDLDALGCISRLGAIVNLKPARGVREGSLNTYGLYNVLGNAWQWCAEGSGAGFSFDTSAKTTTSFQSLFVDQSHVMGKYTGVRLLFVPPP